MMRIQAAALIGGLVIAAGAAQAGLTICNDTASTQSVSIGYKRGDVWMSEGWWNVPAQDCSVVVGGPLENRFYYYRAEINGGDFKGGGYYFCTQPQAYTIRGDDRCEARGYQSEDFREIDTGPSATDFTLTLVN